MYTLMGVASEENQSPGGPGLPPCCHTCQLDPSQCLDIPSYKCLVNRDGYETGGEG